MRELDDVCGHVDIRPDAEQTDEQSDSAVKVNSGGSGAGAYIKGSNGKGVRAWDRPGLYPSWQTDD